jgi:threonine/homoserine/homoserine lactone efflux protein
MWGSETAQAIGQILPLAVGVALSPVPIIGVVLMLATPRARANGLAFILGWVGGIVAVAVVVLVVAGGAGAAGAGQPATWVSVLKLVLGVLLLVIAGRQWRRRPHGEAETDLPKWMRTVDSFGAGRSAGFAALLSAVNPKNLLLVVAAATGIAQTGASTAVQVVALAVFVVIATVGVALPVALYFALGERSAAALDRLRGWMAAHNAAIMAVLCLVIAAKLIGDGFAGLLG